MDTRTYITRFFHNAHGVIGALEKQDEKIAHIVDILFLSWVQGAPVYILGNGGSASTASHLAGDLAKTINDVPGQRGIRALTPWDNIPHISAIVNDRPKEDFFTAWLDTFLASGDANGIPVGIGISVHGGSGSDAGGKWSQNLLKGLQQIKDRGGVTIGFSGFDGGPMAKLVDVAVVVPVEEKDLGTPLVESFHVVAHHLIVFRLKEMIKEFNNKGA
mgnify:CR=1 FL=1